MECDIKKKCVACSIWKWHFMDHWFSFV